MKRILTSLLVFSSMATVAAPSLQSVQLYKQSIDTPYGNITFPRDYELRYRGQEAELFPLEKALRAFYGDKTATVESLDFSSISLILQKKWWIGDTPEDKKMWRMRKYFCKNWKADNRDVNNIKNKYCHYLKVHKVSRFQTLEEEINDYLDKKSKYSEQEANLITQKIMNKKFSYESDRDKKERLVDYNSGRYQDFPSDVLFSTIFQQNAMIYGDTILVLNRNDNRSLDLSYFNGATNGRWGKAADAGEYITPGYIQSSEINGIYLRKRMEYPDKLRNQVRLGTYKIQKDTPIEFAFFKYVDKGETYVLVFDGKRGSSNAYCMTRKNYVFKHCSWAEPMFTDGLDLKLIGNQPLGKVHNYVPNLIAVLTLNEVGKISDRPDHIINKFKYYSSESLDVSLKNSLGIGEDSPLKTIQNFKMQKNGKDHKINIFYTKE